MNIEDRKKLDQMFNPRGIAVFGGTKPGSFGYSVLMSQIIYGYEGRIYPVSSGDGEVFGHKIIKSIKDADGPVDLACISVPAKFVPAILKECLDAGVKGAQIHSSGFTETGNNEGTAIQKEIDKIVAQGIKIIGPNCFGIHSPKGRISLLPAFDTSKESGPVAMISQSGGLANEFIHEADNAGIGVSKVVSFGNGCDIEAVQLIDYLSDDPQTGYIAAYLEGVKDGRKFFETVKKAAAKKPIVIWKGGLTPLGSRATKSHTGSMGGESKIWQGVFEQTGAIAVLGLDEMIDTLKALTYLKSRGRRITLTGGGGAIGVFSSDLAYQWGLEIPAFSEETQQRLRKYFPNPGNSMVNPLDTGTPALPLETLTGAVKEILVNEPIDIMVLIMLMHPLEVVSRAYFKMHNMDPLPRGFYLDGLLEVLSQLKKETGKDIVVVMENRAYRMEDIEVESALREMRKKYQTSGIPVYPNTERALKGIKNASIMRET
ncbi:MAG: CoA-binding protein [Desulfobacterales bacterium]|nr:CoA-binding protein [Desulfobacterales bacterium]